MNRFANAGPKPGAAPVDVLARYDVRIASARALSADAFHAQELPKLEAERAAVAALVEKSRAILAAANLSATTERPFAINSPAIVGLRAALAHMGSDR